jgi:hypothetical protein
VLHQELLMGNRETMHKNIIELFVTNTKIVRSIIDQGIRKKVFKKVDPELTMATILGTINQVMLSKAMCTLLIEREDSFDPYTDVAFRNRLVKHLKQVIHDYLLIKS